LARFAAAAVPSRRCGLVSLTNRHVRIQRIALEHHRHVTRPWRKVVDAAAVEHQFAARERFEPRDHPQRGRFSAPRWSEEDHELAVHDVEVHRSDGICAVRVAVYGFRG
jgi:hypothetical protein